MTTNEEVQSGDIYPINGTIDHGFQENKDGINPFSRTIQKQYSDEDQTDAESTIEKSIPRSLTQIEDFPNKSLTSSRSSVPTIYLGYQRKKSVSVKLTRIEHNDTHPKKVVRFADDFGLDLSQTKMFTDDLPSIPSPTFKNLHISEPMRVITYMEPQFENPIHTQSFIDRVSKHKIVLEQANAIDNRIYGTIKLISLGLHKQVKVRLTTDNWLSCRDYDAVYIPNSHDGIYDRFSFTLEIDRYKICAGNNIQFCLCYESFAGQDYWDNNYQQNYRFNCFSRTIPDYSI